MNPEIPPRIEHPCPMSWSDMSGDSKRRFCDHCQLHVHNLSEMSAVERTQVLGTEDKCVTYQTDAKGRLISHGDQPWLARVFSRMRFGFFALLASVLPFGLSSCVTRQLMGAPVPISDKSTQESPPHHDKTVLGRTSNTENSR